MTSPFGSMTSPFFHLPRLKRSLHDCIGLLRLALSLPSLLSLSFLYVPRATALCGSTPFQPGMLIWPHHWPPCSFAIPLPIHVALGCTFLNLNLAVSTLCMRASKGNTQERKVSVLSSRVGGPLLSDLSPFQALHSWQITVSLEDPSCYLHACAQVDGAAKNPPSQFKSSPMQTSTIF